MAQSLAGAWLRFRERDCIPDDGGRGYVLPFEVGICYTLKTSLFRATASDLLYYVVSFCRRVP